MKSSTIRIIGAVLLVAVIASGWAYRTKVDSGLEWGQVLTLRFGVLTIIHVIPAYFVIWSFEDKGSSWTEARIFLIIIVFAWFIVLCILSFFCRLFFGFELIF